MPPQGDLVVEARGVELDLLMQLLRRLAALEPRLRAAAPRVRPKLSEDMRRLHIAAWQRMGTEIGLEEAQSYRVQVITGANLSGKSVYLKQVGLITYMAQIGCFVPAEEAEVGLCDFIFSRIQSCETASSTTSSFMLDLSQLSLALKHATASSLVLLDEFGKGTRAADGVALLGATIEFLCRWKDGPKALVATHFTEIFRYQLVPGCAEKSFGLDCARKAGLDGDVLDRATEILTLIRRKALPLRAPEDGSRSALCRTVVQQLCALDVENEAEAKARQKALILVWSIIWTARGEAEKLPELPEARWPGWNMTSHSRPQTYPKPARSASPDVEAKELVRLMESGQKTSCCGYWAERGAAKMQQLVAKQLQISRRHPASSLATPRFISFHAWKNCISKKVHRVRGAPQGGVAVLYLDELESSQLQRRSDQHEVEILDVTRGSVVQASDATSDRYVKSWVQRHFVQPYDTTQQRKFFRKHTRHPRYWHGFLWSFVGTSGSQCCRVNWRAI
eukprot:Skav204550  [mRNA]  locus=scaffold3346:126542:150103:- [translate_table: standard]